MVSWRAVILGIVVGVTGSLPLNAQQWQSHPPGLPEKPVTLPPSLPRSDLDRLPSNLPKADFDRIQRNIELTDKLRSIAPDISATLEQSVTRAHGELKVTAEFVQAFEKLMPASGGGPDRRQLDELYGELIGRVLTVDGAVARSSDPYPLALSELAALYPKIADKPAHLIEKKEFEGHIAKRLGLPSPFRLREITDALGIPKSLPYYVIDDPDFTPARDWLNAPPLPTVFMPAHLSCSNAQVVCPTVEHRDTILQLAQATALITHRSRLTAQSGNTYKLDLEAGEWCTLKRERVVHCSAVLDYSRTHAWTAAHCAKGLGVLGVDAIPRGGKGPCWGADGTEALRVVFGLQNRTGLAQPVLGEQVYTCKSVTRIGEDVVKLELERPVPAGLVAAAPPILVASPKTDKIYRPNTVLVGFGFPHTSRLVAMPKGAIADQKHCEGTVAVNFNNLNDARRREIQRRYFCVSTDSLNGASGGPIYALLEDRTVEIAGLFSLAAEAKYVSECHGQRLTAGSARLNMAARIYEEFGP